MILAQHFDDLRTCDPSVRRTVAKRILASMIDNDLIDGVDAQDLDWFIMQLTGEDNDEQLRLTKEFELQARVRLPDDTCLELETDTFDDDPLYEPDPDATEPIVVTTGPRSMDDLNEYLLHCIAFLGRASIGERDRLEAVNHLQEVRNQFRLE